jgi:hypothetical protein
MKLNMGWKVTSIEFATDLSFLFEKYVIWQA